MITLLEKIRKDKRELQDLQNTLLILQEYEGCMIANKNSEISELVTRIDKLKETLILDQHEFGRLYYESRKFDDIKFKDYYK